MKKSSCFLSLLLIFAVTIAVNAQESEEAYPENVQRWLKKEDPKKNKVRLQDGKIVIETNGGNRVLDFDNPDSKYSRYENLKKWKVTKPQTPVDEALNVFAQKSQSANTDERFLLINQENGSEILIEYSTFDPESGIYFSPEEDFVYYKMTQDIGGDFIYGVNLNTNMRFPIGSSSDFNIINCPNKSSSYVALMDDQGQEQSFTIYNLDGSKVDVVHPENFTQFNDLNQYICY